MVLCALCEQPAVAVQILPGGRARPICLLHDVPATFGKPDKRGPDKDLEPPALAAE